MTSKALRNPIIPQEVHNLLTGKITQSQLLDIVRSQGRRGYSKLNKAGLVNLIFLPVTIYLNQDGAEVTKIRYQTLNKNEALKQQRSCPYCGKKKKISRRNWARHQMIHVRQGLKEFNFDYDLFRKDNAYLVGNFILKKVSNRHIRKYNTYQDNYEVKAHSKTLGSLSFHGLFFTV